MFLLFVHGDFIFRLILICFFCIEFPRKITFRKMHSIIVITCFIVEKGSDGMGTADGQYGKPRSQGHQTDLYLHYKKVSLCLYKEHLHVQKQEKTHCLTDLCKEYTVHRTTNSY